MPSVRRATHAGTWYSSSGEELRSQIEDWLSQVTPDAQGSRGIIAPHAGLAYCGHVMAHAFRTVDKRTTRRVFLLGPSHKLWTESCMLTQQDVYSTPLGDVLIDREVCAKLLLTGSFDSMSAAVDEKEHSLELLLPFLVVTMQSQPFTLVPIMVGELQTSRAQQCAAALAPYLIDPSNLFIVSSDFCHWGRRFGYTLQLQPESPIWQSIEGLDQLAMAAIETMNPRAFEAYQTEFRSTICGRNPISLFLEIIQASSLQASLKFLFYDQSSKCMHPTDSSVSYAAAALTVPVQRCCSAEVAAHTL